MVRDRTLIKIIVELRHCPVIRDKMAIIRAVSDWKWFINPMRVMVYATEKMQSPNLTGSTIGS